MHCLKNLNCKERNVVEVLFEVSFILSKGCLILPLYHFKPERACSRDVLTKSLSEDSQHQRLYLSTTKLMICWVANGYFPI